MQGSCLGPLLFILYIKDFRNCLETTIQNMYADDPCVNIASENLNELTSNRFEKNELEDISNRMRINKLNLNAGKSERVVIGHR